MLKGNQSLRAREHNCGGSIHGFIPQELGVLSGVDINLYIAAMYKSGGAGQIDSKTLSLEHVIIYQYICFQQVNQIQLAAHACVNLMAFFINTRNVDCHSGKVS